MTALLPRNGAQSKQMWKPTRRHTSSPTCATGVPANGERARIHAVAQGSMAASVAPGAGSRWATVPPSRPLEGVVDHLGEGDRGVVACTPFGIETFQRSRCDHVCLALALVEELLHALACGLEHRIELGDVGLVRERAMPGHHLGAVVATSTNGARGGVKCVRVLMPWPQYQIWHRSELPSVMKAEQECGCSG